MNITPLYNLRLRLKNAMIQGTNLLSEDFRLKRAIEEFSPLMKAAPVFAKIGELSNRLLDPEENQKEKMLLDAITLLDAVLCTQAATGINEPASQEGSRTLAEDGYDMACNTESIVSSQPYSRVKPLIEALTTSGGGHYAYVMEMHENYPEVFEDYRVQAALVQALGAGYAELEEQVESWLKEAGRPVVPLLKQGFDPAGKKEMVRRVRIIDELSQGEENEFYKVMIPSAVKEVRQALIYALRHSRENEELLIQMTKTESGNAKKMAFYTLAGYNSEQVRELFDKMYQKKPLDVLGYLYLSEADWASAWLAKRLEEKLLEWEERFESTGIATLEEKEEAWWLSALKACVGKGGKDMAAFFRHADEMMKKRKLSIVWTRERKRFEQAGEIFWDSMERGKAFGNELAYTLMRCLKAGQDKELCETALALYDTAESMNQKNFYLAPALLARLYGTEDCTEWIRAQFAAKKNSDQSIYVGEALTGICYDGKDWIMKTDFYPALQIQCVQKRVILNSGIEEGLTELLISYQTEDTDKILIQMAKQGSKTFREKITPYFYKRALASKSVPLKLMEALQSCGCPYCENLLIHCVSIQPVHYWTLTYYIECLPGTEEAREGELRRMLELAEKRKLEIKNWTGNFEELYNMLSAKIREHKFVK